jgi:hypothetical protein
VTAGLLSAASLVLFWHLVTGPLAPRAPVAQLVALLVFALSPGMAVLRFDTESVVPAQLLLCAALWALGARRERAALLLALLLPLARGDGWVSCAILCFAAWRQASEASRARAVVLAGIGGVAALLGLDLLTQRALLPPAAGFVPFLSSYDRLFSYETPSPARDVAGWLAARTFDQFTERAWAAFDALRHARLVAHDGAWFAIYLLALVTTRRRNVPGHVVCWALLLGGAAFVSWASPIVFAEWRTLHPFLPVVVLTGTFAFDDVLAAGARWAAAAGNRPLRGAVVGGVVFALVGPLAADSHLYGDRDAGPVALTSALAARNATLAGRPVAARRPWFVIAETDSPAISIPSNGEAAIVEALTHYEVAWLVLTDEGCAGASKDVCATIRDGKTTRLGRLSLSRVSDEDGVALFSVVQAP